MPKFVFNYIKSTSITGKLRDPTNFKIRKQDGPKYRLLCGDCEQLFSESEKYFKEKVFMPYIGCEKVNLKYDLNLQYYIESVHWRFLLTQINSYELEQQQILKDIEISIRTKLRFQKTQDKTLVLLQLNYPEYPRRSSHYLFSMDERLAMLLSDGYSFKRMVTCDLFFHKKQVYIYSYYCGLIICSVYNSRGVDFLNLIGFLIRREGRLRLKKAKLNNIIVLHLLQIKHRVIMESLDKVSNEDREKFLKIIEKSRKEKDIH